MSSHRKAPLPAHYGKPQPGVCRWCNEPCGGKSTWHADCVTAYKLIHWPAETRKAVFERDKGICARCGKDAESDFKRRMRAVPGLTSLDECLMRSEARKLFGVWGDHWSCQPGREWIAEQRATRDAHYGFPKGNSGWQHDHIRPLIEANGDLSFWQLDNIQTLCTACHILKGREDHARRRANRQLKLPL